MHHLLRLSTVAILLGACAQPQAQGSRSSAVQEPSPSASGIDGGTPKTQVYFLGTLYGGHLESETWGLDQLRTTIRAIDPDVVCPEIPPDRWPETLATWQERRVVEDSHVQLFPEYVDVLLPLMDEMDFAVSPVSGWGEYMAMDRQAKTDAFLTEERFLEARAAYAHDRTWVAEWLASWPVPADDDPAYLHSPLHGLRAHAEAGPYQHHLDDVIGRPGGWSYINHDHFLLIDKAIRDHPGKRILVTFGADQKFWLLQRLRWLSDVEIMDVRPYLPDAQPLSPEQQVEDAFLLGFDSLDVWWSSFRGDTLLAWDHLEAILDFEGSAALLARLRGTKGMFWSDFQDGPFLGPLEVAPLGEGAYRVRATVLQLGDALPADPAAASLIEATLRPDPKRPEGFVWTDLVLPAWLLERKDA